MKSLIAILFSLNFINCMAESSLQKDTTSNLNFIAEELLIRIKINDKKIADSLILVLQKVSIEEIDFTPELDRTNALKSLMRRIRLPRPIMNLALISVSRDTGYKILRKFKNNPAHQFELFSFLSTDSNKYSRWYEYSNSYIKKFVPERFSIFPKSRNYVVSNNYLQMDFSLLRNGWECFCWKGKLVGLHFRSVGNKRVAAENDIADLREFLRLSKILK
jgi:hypothetical protein